MSGILKFTWQGLLVLQWEKGHRTALSDVKINSKREKCCGDGEEMTNNGK